MGNLIVFGTGDIAELADFYFRHDSDYQVAAFTVDGEYVKQGTFCSKPVVPFEEIGSAFPPTENDFFVALSYAKLNQIRASKVADAKLLGYRVAHYVSSRASVFPEFHAGENCFILEDNTIQPFVRIGSNVTLWSGNHIGHHTIIEDNVFVTSQVVISGGVHIGANSFIGVNATIRDHVKIGRRCVIGAGSLILSDAEDESVYSPGGTERSRIPSSRLRGI